MVLGESHYCDEECADCGDCRLHRECMGFTQQVLDDYLNEKPTHTEIEYNKMYPTFGKFTDKEFEDWRKEYKRFHLF